VDLVIRVRVDWPRLEDPPITYQELGLRGKHAEV